MSMFDMMPFEHRNHMSYNPFRDLEKWERSYGSFSRSFDISNIKSEEISGAYHDGVLTLTLPKKSPTAPSTSRRLDIQ